MYLIISVSFVPCLECFNRIARLVEHARLRLHLYVYQHYSNYNDLGPEVCKHGVEVWVLYLVDSQVGTDQENGYVIGEGVGEKAEELELDEEVGNDHDLGVDDDRVPEGLSWAVFLDQRGSEDHTGID